MWDQQVLAVPGTGTAVSSLASCPQGLLNYRALLPHSLFLQLPSPGSPALRVSLPKSPSPHCHPSHVHTQTFIIVRKSFPRHLALRQPPAASLPRHLLPSVPASSGCFPSHSRPFQVLVSIFQHLSFLTFQQPSLLLLLLLEGAAEREKSHTGTDSCLYTCNFQGVGYTQQCMKLTWGGSFSTLCALTQPQTPAPPLSG